MESTSHVREEIALIREQVLRSIESASAAEGHEARLVMITSSRSGEGKSFIALNLAASIAEGSGLPVILADAEGHGNSLTYLLGLHGEPGLAELHDVDGADRAELLRRTEVPGLFLLPSGTAKLSPARSGAVAEALHILARHLPDHIIVLDTPACLETSVAGVLAAAAGQIALVVEAERTERAEVEAALDILDACPTLQLLLNRSALSVKDSFRARAPHADDEAVRAYQA